MANRNGLYEESETWSVFLGAYVHNRICWDMTYLSKEGSTYYKEYFQSTYGGHIWGNSYQLIRNEVFEADAPENIRRIIEADRQGKLEELICRERYIVFSDPHYDFGSLEYLRIPEVLRERLKELDSQVVNSPEGER